MLERDKTGGKNNLTTSYDTNNVFLVKGTYWQSGCMCIDRNSLCAHAHLCLDQSLVTALDCDKPASRAHQRNMTTACPAIQMITTLRHHAYVYLC